AKAPLLRLSCAEIATIAKRHGPRGWAARRSWNGSAAIAVAVFASDRKGAARGGSPEIVAKLPQGLIGGIGVPPARGKAMVPFRSATRALGKHPAAGTRRGAHLWAHGGQSR